MQEKTNIQTSTLRVPKNILEEIKIYCRKAGKPVGEWVETAWKFIEKNDFDIYDKETTPFLPVPPDIEKERNQVEALCIIKPTTESVTNNDIPADSLVYVVNDVKLPFEIYSALDRNKIETVTVIKDSTAIQKYWEKDKKGVLYITLKK